MYFSGYYKCILIENYPGIDFKVWFYVAKVPHRGYSSQMTENIVKFYTFIGENKVNSLKENIKICLIHAKKLFNFLALESIIWGEGKNMCTQKPVSDVYCKFIDSFQNLEPAKTPFNWLMAKLVTSWQCSIIQCIKDMSDLALKRHGDIQYAYY